MFSMISALYLHARVEDLIDEINNGIGDDKNESKYERRADDEIVISVLHRGDEKSSHSRDGVNVFNGK
jgi:hypothetical protein